MQFPEKYDLVIVGAGTAGMPCAIEAVAAGLTVLVVEKEPTIGGTLHVSLGQMSGAGTALQRDRGIVDDPGPISRTLTGSIGARGAPMSCDGPCPCRVRPSTG